MRIAAAEIGFLALAALACCRSPTYDRGGRRGDERQDRSSLASVVGSPDPERDSGAAVFEMEGPWASSQLQTRSARYSAGGIACCAASEPAAWGPFTSRSTSCWAASAP